jgi:hypothetical protein
MPEPADSDGLSECSPACSALFSPLNMPPGKMLQALKQETKQSKKSEGNNFDNDENITIDTYFLVRFACLFLASCFWLFFSFCFC